MAVGVLSSEHEIAWERFILESEKANFFFQLGYKRIIQDIFSFSPIYLLASENNEIKGILPLFIIKKKLISLPFSTKAGIIASPEAADLLIQKAKEITKEKKLDYLELRQEHNFNTDLQTKDCYYTLKLKLEEPSIMFQSFRRDVKRKIKKAQESNIEIVKGHEYLDDFYKIFSYNMHKLGTPVDDYNLFKKLLDEFPKSTNIYIAKLNKKPIATIFMLYFNKTAESFWASSYPKYNSIGVNRLIYWQAIQDAYDQDYTCFDFGRSVLDEGTYNFKIAWNTIPLQLNYKYFVNKGSIPDITKKNFKRKLFAFSWKKLPLFLANKIGPKIRRQFP